MWGGVGCYMPLDMKVDLQGEDRNEDDSGIHS